MYKIYYSQWIALGANGNHGDHVQRHVVQAPRHAQGQRLGHVMAEVHTQDLQPPPHHATQIYAQAQVIISHPFLSGLWISCEF